MRLGLVILILIASSATATAADRVVIVMDASGSMYRSGDGKTPVFVTVREALATVLTEAPLHGRDLQIGLRLAGGEPAAVDIEGCASSRLEIPLGPVEPRRWGRALDDVQPHGFRPLVAAVLAALGDLAGESKNQRLVIVTSGDDQCGGTPQQVAAALAAQDLPTDLRLVGLGLEPTILNQYGAVPNRNVATASELLAALRWAVFDDSSDERPKGELSVRLVGTEHVTGSVQLELTDLHSPSTRSQPLPDADRFELAAGRYRVRLDTTDAPGREFRDLVITAGSLSQIELDLGAEPASVLDVMPNPAVAGSSVWIAVDGSIRNHAEMLFVDSDGRALTPVRSLAPEGSRMPSPLVVGDTELVLVEPERSGVRRVLTSIPVTVVDSVAVLEVPDEIALDEALTVDVSGPDGETDFVAVVPSGGHTTDIMMCRAMTPSNDAGFPPFGEEGEFDVIYVAGPTLTVKARESITVSGPAASVKALATVPVGRVFEVGWSGPENDEDFIAIAASGDSAGDYLDWSRIDRGNPAALHAPQSPGAYEVRYVDGQTGDVLARSPVDVVEIAITVEAPSEVKAGLRFVVHWTGPAARGDYLAVARPKDAADRYLDWASLVGGSPTTLSAPTRPGSYELRYVTGSGREVAARIAIEVMP